MVWQIILCQLTGTQGSILYVRSSLFLIFSKSSSLAIIANAFPFEDGNEISSSAVNFRLIGFADRELSNKAEAQTRATLLKVVCFLVL